MKKTKLMRLVTGALSIAMLLGAFTCVSNAYSYLPPNLPIAGAWTEDYTGLGYYLNYWPGDSKSYEVQLIGSSGKNHDWNNNSKLALGDIRASIFKSDGKYYLNFRAKYEIDLDVWFMVPGQVKDNNCKNPYTSVIGAPLEVTGITNTNTTITNYDNATFEYTDATMDEMIIYYPGTNNGTATYRTEYALATVGNPSYWHTTLGGSNTTSTITKPWGEVTTVSGVANMYADYSNGWTFRYTGPDGILPVTLKINNKSPLTINIPYNTPANYYVSYDCYCGEIDQTFLIDPAYGDVRGIQITDILGNDVNMYVTSDEETSLYPDIIDSVGYVDKRVSSTSTNYTIQLNSQPYISGNYDIKFLYYLEDNSWHELTINRYISSLFGVDETINLSIPYPNVKSLMIVGMSTNASDGTFRGYSDNHAHSVQDWTYGINFVSNAHETLDHVVLDEKVEYTIADSTAFGDYIFYFSYTTYDENGHRQINYSSDTYNLHNYSGFYHGINSSEGWMKFPKDSAEIKLVSIRTPNGYLDVRNETLYVNPDAVPEAPTSFAATMTTNRIERNANGVGIHMTLDYQTPEKARYSIVYEYEIDNHPYYETVPVTLQAGYNTYTWGDGSTTNCLYFPRNSTYVKVYYVLNSSGSPVSCSADGTLLYCAHKYSDDFDTTCDIPGCNEERNIDCNVLGHDPDSNYCDATCTRCGQVMGSHAFDGCEDLTCNNNCGYVRPTSAHVYDNCTDMECNICHNIRPYVSIGDEQHQWEYACDTYCDICGAHRNFVETPHRYATDSDLTCEDCGYIRELNPVYNITHYWRGYDEGNQNNPIYYAEPLNNGEWGSGVVCESRMPTMFTNIGVRYEVSYNGNVIYSGSGATANLTSSEIPNFAAGEYTISFYCLDGRFIYSDTFTVR